MTSPRVVIVDDHPLLAVGLQRELERSGASVELADVVADGADLVAVISSREPDCAVVDLGLPLDGGGVGLIGPLVSEGLRVVVLTGETDRRQWARSTESGAQAVVAKTEPLPDIVETILRVAEGHPVRRRQRAELAVELQRLDAGCADDRARFAGLSPREEQVLAGLMAGQGPAALAARDYVAVATVRTQIKSLLRKLGVGSQLEAVALAHRHRWEPGRPGS